MKYSMMMKAAGFSPIPLPDNNAELITTVTAVRNSNIF
jgi:hypothetical protein